MTRPVRLLLVTGTRADFGLWLPVLGEARRRFGRVEASLLVTAMHLDQRFGETVEQVRESGFEIAVEVACTPEGDGRADMSEALGVALQSMTPALVGAAPDWLMVLGDRGEQLAAALAALHLGIAVAHLHGGEITRGAVDDTLRDLITRIAHLHLAANEEAASRLRRLGEEEWRIKVTGAPGLDLLADEARGDLPTLRRRFGLGESGPYLLVVHHPETVGEERGVRDLSAVLGAVEASGLPALAIHPNADAGGRAMSDLLRRAEGSVQSVASLSRADYATLLRGAAAIVGNSSSGIIEAPLMRVPAVNVGQRQAGRTRGDNVLDVPAEEDAIRRAIAAVLEPGFRDRLTGQSPYGDGAAAPRILDAVEATPLDRRLLEKHVAESADDDR